MYAHFGLCLIFAKKFSDQDIYDSIYGLFDMLLTIRRCISQINQLP